jgi:hypothetical protein
LDDRALGAAAIALHGGAVLIQDPAAARQPDMPRAALVSLPQARVVPAADLGRLITEMVTGSCGPGADS